MNISVGSKYKPHIILNKKNKQKLSLVITKNIQSHLSALQELCKWLSYVTFRVGEVQTSEGGRKVHFW